jgi:hypothetical protein
MELSNNSSIQYGNSTSPVTTSIRINFIFWISVLGSIILISYYTTGNNNNSYISGIFTYIFIAFWGYLMHYISHYTNFSKVYKESTNVVCTLLHKTPIINPIIETILYYTMDFHSIIHHDSSINKTPTNIIVEAVQNFLTQGGLLILFNNILEPMFMFKHTGLKITLNNSILMLWALFYATVHNINYNLTHPIEHKHHHIDANTNYGIDIVDIILNTKYNTIHHPEKTTFEDHNHASINIILLTIYLIWPYLK